jgi:hypothetical protein
MLILATRCFAVSTPKQHEERALGTRLRRGKQCYSGVINALRAWNEISLSRVTAVSLVGKAQNLNLAKHRQGWNKIGMTENAAVIMHAFRNNYE